MARQRSTATIGVDVRAGVSHGLQPNLALFGEYRFTHVSPDFSFTRFAAATDVGATFDTHHFVFGASFKF